MRFVYKKKYSKINTENKKAEEGMPTRIFSPPSSSLSALSCTGNSLRTDANTEQ